jgi:hypothetical protein
VYAGQWAITAITFKSSTMAMSFYIPNILLVIIATMKWQEAHNAERNLFPKVSGVINFDGILLTL